MREALRAIMGLIKESPEWRRFFKACCQEGFLRLHSQAWQFDDELRDRGHEFGREDVEDALFELAHALLPDSPATKWDPKWAVALASKALRYLNERYVDGADLSVLEPWWDKLDATGMAQDQEGYRAAIRAFVKAGLRSFDAARRGAA